MRLVLRGQLRCGSLSITTPVSLLANEFDVGQVSLAAVNQICVIHEAMNSCENLKCLENVNIYESTKYFMFCLI